MWLSCPKGLGKGHSFWMVTVPCECHWVWLGGRGCEMQAVLGSEPSSPPPLPCCAPCLPSTAKTALCWVCVLAALFWLTLDCPDLLGGSRSQDRDNGD